MSDVQPNNSDNEWVLKEAIQHHKREAQSSFAAPAGSAAADCWHHAEKIRCPKCGSIEDAAVAHTRPFWTYIHECKCGYIIMEQEWDQWRVDEPPNITI